MEKIRRSFPNEKTFREGLKRIFRTVDPVTCGAARSGITERLYERILPDTPLSWTCRRITASIFHEEGAPIWVRLRGI